MKTATIRQRVVIHAPPETVYRALLSSRIHAAFTGSSARITAKVGSKFMAWGGYIHGENLRLVPGRRIVQSWRAFETEWPRTHLSRVEFRLAPVTQGTRLTLTHSGVPSTYLRQLSKGWKWAYWDPMNRYFAEHPPA
ncbi:MAG TPA: SRPBCC domain-containing protein [Thermoplasmata archaeon]